MEILSEIIYNPKTKYVIITLLLAIFLFLCAYSYSNAVSSDFQSNLLRLHVLANSNSKEDQNLKYAVRDNILEYVNNLSKDAKINSKEELVSLVNFRKEEIKNIAEQTVQDMGYSYTVNVAIGNYNFPTKTYGDISLPSGPYDALRIEIGEAEGQNWWCVMFPPLCFVDVSSGIVPEDSKETLQDNLSDEEYLLILNESSENLKLKFKIVELFGNMNISTAKK